MKKSVNSFKKVHGKQFDGLNMPSLPKEFILKSVSDSNIDPHIVTYFDPKSPITEQYRRLREHIKNIQAKENMKTFSINSSTANEGKTLTALNLAVAMTKDVDCKSVLLVDCDLHRGEIEKYIGMAPKAGLSEYLHVNTEADNIICKTKINKLSIIQRGKITDNPADLLTSLKMKALLKELKDKFDIIILDTPPVIPVAESAAISALADGVVMVVRAGKTQRGIVKHAAEILNTAKAHLLGYVLTHVEHYIPEYIYKYI
ncbi:MAG: CpsD/CapB family tyrosine-protein kinase [Candidatus Omnitrophota bacterium]